MNATRRLLGAAALVLMLAGCHPPTENSSRVPAFQLKLYHVPGQQSQVVADNLRKVLVNSGYLVGLKAHTEMNVSQPFPGAVLVLAPASMQPSIGDAIAEMGKTVKAASSKGPTATALRVHFWVVQAKAGAGADAPTLRALEPTLKGLRASLGSSHFVLDESVSAVTNAYNHASSGATLQTNKHHQFNFNSKLTAGGDIWLEVEYNDKTGRTIPHLQTGISVQPGTYVVLAQAPSTDDAASGSATTLMNLLVVSVDKIASTSH